MRSPGNRDPKQSRRSPAVKPSYGLDDYDGGADAFTLRHRPRHTAKDDLTPTPKQSSPKKPRTDASPCLGGDAAGRKRNGRMETGRRFCTRDGRKKGTASIAAACDRTFETSARAGRRSRSSLQTQSKALDGHATEHATFAGTAALNRANRPRRYRKGRESDGGEDKEGVETREGIREAAQRSLRSDARSDSWRSFAFQGIGIDGVDGRVPVGTSNPWKSDQGRHVTPKEVRSGGGAHCYDVPVSWTQRKQTRSAESRRR